MRFPAKKFAGFAYVRLISSDIGGMPRMLLNSCFFAKQLFCESNQVVDGDDLVSAEVDNLIAEGFECQDNATMTPRAMSSK